MNSKKYLIVLLAIMALSVSVAIAATQEKIWIIPPDASMVIENPLLVKTSFGVVGDYKINTPNKIYPGQEIGIIDLTITNVSPTEQCAYVYLRTGTEEKWPPVDIFISKDGKRLLNNFIVTPGKEMTVRVTIKVGHVDFYVPNQNLDFKGLELRVRTVPYDPSDGAIG